MNISSLSTNSNSWIQQLESAAFSALNSSQNNASGTSGTSGSTSMPQDGSPQLSPFAQIMSTLQQLQQSNPTEYSQVTQQIASGLQSASQQAQASGNSSEAQQLSTLANDFTNASTSGQLPNVSDLAQAIGGGHHHHHHEGSGGSSSSTSSSSGSSSSSSSASGSSSSSSTNSSTNSSAPQSLSELFGAYANNSSQSEALNPLNIIMNTFQNDGISLGN